MFDGAGQGGGGPNPAPFSPGGKRRPGEDDSMDGGKNIGWWVKNQDLVKFDGPFLMENTKKMFGTVFQIIDDDSNGEIDSEDFATMPAAMDKWEELKMEFSSESAVNPRDFVLGIKKMAWKKAVDQTKFGPADLQNYSRFTSKLNKALNDSIENTLRDLLCAMIVYSREAMERMQEAWAVLDFDKDGSITVKDFETRPGATAQATDYFTKLANMLDEDHDGTITQAEFEFGLKRIAVKTLDPSVFPPFHYGAAQSSGVAGVSSGRLQKFQAAANDSIVSACKEIIGAMR